jgi:hypothetical protein
MCIMESSTHPGGAFTPFSPPGKEEGIVKAHENFTETEDLEYYRSLISYPLIKVQDEDAIEVSGWTIYIHENARASKVKGKMRGLK